jgi:hypothetical protein
MFGEILINPPLAFHCLGLQTKHLALLLERQEDGKKEAETGFNM